MGDARSEEAPSACLTPLLMVYYLCCWPGDAKSEGAKGDARSDYEGKSDTSSERNDNRRRNFEHESGSHRRGSEFFSRRVGSSAVSLHLPSTSGHKKEPLSAHRSHEEIGRRKSNHSAAAEESRYHSAPSVIDEVLHRRDWDRSARDLRVPLHPDGDLLSASSGSPDPDPDPDPGLNRNLAAPRAEPESSSIEEHRSDEQIVGRACKKHYTNIKSSKKVKEKEADDDKDSDATEASSFYIGDNERSPSSITNSPRKEDVNLQTKSIYKAKEAKQSFNESIRSKERPRRTLVSLEEHQPRTFGFRLDDVIDQLESLDRSGATHHTIESRISLSKPAFPPPSVEAAGYESGACYLAGPGGHGLQPGGPGMRPVGPAPAGALRARHASDGDILAPPHRPESGAFSESDLDLDPAEGAPPPYHELHALPSYAAPPRKETAI